jgi:putative flippase GtrA
LIRRIRSGILRLWSVQFLRFLIVGGINTVFGYSVFAAFILLHLHYVLAALMAQICGVLFNFRTTGTLVFKNRNDRLILRFFGVYLSTYLSSIALLRIFEYYGVTSLVAGAIVLMPMALVSYFLNRRFVFPNLSAKHTKNCA